MKTTPAATACSEPLVNGIGNPPPIAPVPRVDETVGEGEKDERRAPRRQPPAEEHRDDSGHVDDYA